MRNLKRALSLALASVMLLGMMVVGTSASYADVTSKQNKEAIEVAQAVGVMIGDDKGNFNPDAKVTRVEMAVVMSNLLNLKVNDFKAAKTEFTDVPAWAAPYVAACKADGIIAGYSATTFGANDTVTAAQAGLMVMKALGYFQFAADFGDSWQLSTVKQASKIDLYDGIDANANAALTRNDVAQLVLNALEATMVEADGNGGTTIEGNGFTITTGSTKYVDVVKSNADGKYDKISADKNDGKFTVELGEKLFDGKLEKKDDTDDLGRPANQWMYKGEDIGTYGKTADRTYVLTKTYTVTDKDSLVAVLQDKNLTNNDKLDLVKGKPVYVNGHNVDFNDAKVKAAFNNDAKGGVVVELFYNEDDSNVVDYVVILNYSMKQIDDVSTKLTKDQKDDGATSKIKVNGKYYTDNKIADFNAKTYVEDAYLLYITNTKNDEIVASQIAEEVTGTVTALKGSDRATVSGTTYKYVSALKDKIDVDDEGTFYLNVAGQIAVVDTTSKSSDYAYIYAVDQDTKKNSDGIEATTFTAYMVLTDGTKVSYVVDTDEKTEGKTTTYYFADTKVEISESYKGVIAYELNSDKELVYKTAKDKIALVEGMKVDKDNASKTDSSTKFIFTWTKDNKQKVSVATGYKNVSFTNNAYTVTTDDSDKDILYVFVGAENGSVSSDSKYAVVLSNTATVTKNSDGDKVYTYSVSVEGEDITLDFDTKQDFTKGQVFAYEMDGDYAKIDDDASINEMAKVYSATKDYIKFTEGGKQYNLGKDETIYTITVEYKNSAKVDPDADNFDPAAHVKDIDTVSVSEGGKVETDDYAIYALDGTDLDVVFVFEFIG